MKGKTSNHYWERNLWMMNQTHQPVIIKVPALMINLRKMMMVIALIVLKKITKKQNIKKFLKIKSKIGK